MSAARSFPIFATLVSLGLLSACFGKREEPTIQSLGTGNVGGHNSAGGNGNGGNGGAGGTGGTTDGGGGANPDGGGGNGGAPADGGGGAGGGPAGAGSAIYPLCGCIADFNGAGACQNCMEAAFDTSDPDNLGSCAEISSACSNNGTCSGMLLDLMACEPLDAACFDAIAAAEPMDMPISFDDLVSLMECGCNACAFCDEAACE